MADWDHTVQPVWKIVGQPELIVTEVAEPVAELIDETVQPVATKKKKILVEDAPVEATEGQ